jgi:hypothetical protein
MCSRITSFAPPPNCSQIAVNCSQIGRRVCREIPLHQFNPVQSNPIYFNPNQTNPIPNHSKSIESKFNKMQSNLNQTNLNQSKRIQSEPMQSKVIQFKKHPTVPIIKYSGLCESSSQLARTFRLDEPKSAKFKNGKSFVELMRRVLHRNISLIKLF